MNGVLGRMICPNCGSTRGTDLSPCICGYDPMTREVHKIPSIMDNGKQCYGNEFICSEDLLIKLINKLIEKTEQKKIFWHRKNTNVYYTETIPILSIVIDNLEVIINIRKGNALMYKKINIGSSMWDIVNKLSSTIKENNKSIEMVIDSMLTELEKLK